MYCVTVTHTLSLSLSDAPARACLHCLACLLPLPCAEMEEAANRVVSGGYTTLQNDHVQLSQNS